MKIKKAGFIALPASNFGASLIFYRDHLELPIIKEGEDEFSRFAHFFGECAGLPGIPEPPLNGSPARRSVLSTPNPGGELISTTVSAEPIALGKHY